MHTLQGGAGLLLFTSGLIGIYGGHLLTMEAVGLILTGGVNAGRNAWQYKRLHDADNLHEQNKTEVTNNLVSASTNLPQMILTGSPAAAMASLGYTVRAVKNRILYKQGQEHKIRLSKVADMYDSGSFREELLAPPKRTGLSRIFHEVADIALDRAPALIFLGRGASQMIEGVIRSDYVMRAAGIALQTAAFAMWIADRKARAETGVYMKKRTEKLRNKFEEDDMPDDPSGPS